MKQYKFVDTIVGWIIFAVATFSYILTIEPTASFWDCGEFIVTAFRQEVGHPPGAPFFMILGRFFSLFAFGDVTKVPVMINCLSALASSFTVLFLYWSITHIARRIICEKNKEISIYQAIVIIGSGIIGSLSFAYTDTFWFSAVEGEVYAMSSLFTAVVFWCILKWEEEANTKYANRWIILIAYLMGLSIGVHLLNLLAIPAIVFVYYFRLYKVSVTGVIKAFIVSVLILGGVLYGIIPGVVWLASRFELVFTNGFGAPYNTGTIIYAILALGGLVYGLYYTYTKNKVLLNTILLGVTVIIIGYSSFAMIVIRSAAEPPMDENNPNNVFSLQSYLNREQYGDRPLFSGEYFNSDLIAYEEGNPNYIQRNGKYEIADYKSIRKYDPSSTTIFPRMYSPEQHHIQGYQYWADITDVNKKPTFAQNMKFFFNYQVGYMYLRYFMWNFVGRQNDIQGHNSNVMNGNWISGIPFIDNARLGDQDLLPDYLQNNKGTNKYYFIPLLLAILGMIFMLKKNEEGKKYFWVIMLFFFFTGVAIIVYLNQTPFQPRERDYSFAGSFYAFAMYIGLGVAFLCNILKKYTKENHIIASAIVAICMISPLLLACQNWDDHNRSYRYTARDFAKNYLSSCEPNAILFTNGDNDTFPLWYVQEVEGFRTDVRVVNLAYINTDWYIDQMKRKAYNSEALPISLNHSQYEASTRDLVYINNQDGLFVNEKFEANKQFKTRFDALYNQLISILDQSNFRQMMPSDYEVIANRQINQLTKFASLVNTINSKATSFGVNTANISSLKSSTDILLRDVCNAPAPLSNIISFIADDTDNSKAMSQGGEKVDYAPTGKFLLPVDKEKVIKNGTVPEKDSALIVDAVTWTHPGTYIRKGQLAVLDILAQNNWERPIYFAFTVGSEAYQNLDGYFRLDGFAYRFVPIKTKDNQTDHGTINTDILYENVMNKFVWGGINDERVYLDENNLRMLMNVKSCFVRLATQLIDERKLDKAQEVMNRCIEVMPYNLVPVSYYDMFIAECFYKIGDNEKGREIIELLANQTKQEITYFLSLSKDKLSTVSEDNYRSTAIAHEIVRILKEQKDNDLANKWAINYINLLKNYPEIMSIENADINSIEFTNWYSTLSQDMQQLIAIYLYLVEQVSM
ncbi:MAG: DUF2723 domain-containing protein [Bacteroidales bacterium]|nr:DUF2723 domain-containing protein [Bacteroidales bacterium]